MVNEQIVYPKELIRSVPEYMPESVRSAFIEAQSIAGLSPRASCAMLRVCLERLVNEAGGTGNRLVDKIESLELSPRLKRLCDACRLAGNEAVHRELFDFSVGNREAYEMVCHLVIFIERLNEEFFGLKAAADDVLQQMGAKQS